MAGLQKKRQNKKNIISPYGDTLDDGVIQLSFTLPVKNSSRARKAAELYTAKLNLRDISVVHAQEIADSFTFFVVYAKANPTLDYDKVHTTDIDIETMGFSEINELIKDRFSSPISVVGATIGHDAHTVGIDAIMNMKGYDHDYGLERYPQINAYNMGSQITNEMLIKKALEVNADAILVSQTVTQKKSHMKNLTAFIELLEAEEIRDKFLLLAGGSRITNDFALDLGYDAGFGLDTRPSQVATFIVTRLIEKI